MNPAETIADRDCLPEIFLQSARRHFPETNLHGRMLEINELSRMLSADAHRSQWLSAEEQHKYSSLKFEKRRNEWLCGRICAKLAARQMRDISAPRDYRKIVVVNSEGGRPLLRVDGQDQSHNLDISISHSGNLAAALIANNFCGIDIQETNDTLLRVKERFCSRNDEKTLANVFKIAIDATELNLIWTAKEAIRKTLSYYKVPGFLALNLCNVEMIQKDLYVLHFSYKDQTASTICGAYKNYSLAICVQKGIADAGTS